MSFAGRRVRNTFLLLFVSVLALLAFQVLELTLLIQQYYSGWALVVVILLLLSFGVKKRLSVLPLGGNASWAQLHYYAGLFLLVLFFIHIEFSIPNGLVELTLASILLFTVLVGVGGLMVNRIYARRLSQLGEELIYERIGMLRAELKRKLESRLLDSIEQSKSSTLSSYYLENLAAYFSSKQDLLAHMIGSTYRHQKRRADLEQQLRYLNKDEADFAIQMLGFLEQKYILDCHAALQGVLKYWGVLHAPIALVMSGLAVFHIVLVYAFRGAM